MQPDGFTDREGFLYLPFQAAEEVAKTMAKREPQSVQLYLQGHEEGLLAWAISRGQRTALGVQQRAQVWMLRERSMNEMAQARHDHRPEFLLHRVVQHAGQVLCAVSVHRGPNYLHVAVAMDREAQSTETTEP
jgi:hypothetical protein